jgi:hypothetical protein
MTREQLGDHIDAQLRHPQGGISERVQKLLGLADEYAASVVRQALDAAAEPRITATAQVRRRARP